MVDLLVGTQASAYITEDAVVISIGRNELRRSDLDTLEEGEWLNDCVSKDFLFCNAFISEEIITKAFSNHEFLDLIKFVFIMSEGDQCLLHPS